MMATEHELLGAPVTDSATGRLIGRIKAVIHAPQSEGGVRFAVELPADPLEAMVGELGGMEPTEPMSQYDYMVGQYACAALRAADGTVLVSPNERITPAVLERARRAGLLHRLEARFTPLPR